MKKHTSRYVALLVLAFSSCQLDETIYSSIYTEAFYKTASDAEKGLIAAYDPLADMCAGPALTLVSDFSADQSYPRAVVGRNTLTLFVYDPNYTTQRSAGRTNESPQQLWASSYDGIEKANWVIEKVPGATMDATRKAQITGEAYFLRAFYHWTLTKNFGDVPVKTSPSYTEAEALVGKSTTGEVYAQVYADLEAALASGLPSYPNVEKGRPSREAVNALYAKAALYHEDWPLALQKAREVINSGKHQLVESLTDLYAADKEDAARIENIWAFEAESFSPGRTHQLMSLMGPAGSAAPAYGKTTFGSMFAFPSFYNSFDPRDKRRELMDTNYVNTTGKVVPQGGITPITPQGILIKKYQEPGSVGANTSRNIPIFRLADLYLIAAEAEARQNGPTPAAYGYVHAVRKRAGLGELAAGLSKEAFLDAVLQERSWEFFAEGDRWYDLTRTGKFLTEVPKAVNNVYPARAPQAKNRYFPIPQDEINANPKLEQNPDWQ